MKITIETDDEAILVKVLELLSRLSQTDDPVQPLMPAPGYPLPWAPPDWHSPIITCEDTANV